MLLKSFLFYAAIVTQVVLAASFSHREVVVGEADAVLAVRVASELNEHPGERSHFATGGRSGAVEAVALVEHVPQGVVSEGVQTVFDKSWIIPFEQFDEGDCVIVVPVGADVELRPAPHTIIGGSKCACCGSRSSAVRFSFRR